MTPPRIHRVAWTTDVGRWTLEQLEAMGGWAGCDALVAVSVTRGLPAGAAYANYSVEGTTGRAVDALTLFKAWATLAKECAERADMLPAARACARQAYDQARALVAAEAAKQL